MKALTSNNTPKVILRYILTVFSVFTVGFMLLRFPETASQGITEGIDLSLGTLIPSLYPFMVLSTFVIETGVFTKTSTLADRLMKKLFSLTGNSVSVIFLSMIGGLPLGCKMVSELYGKGKISPVQGRRMMLFCFCTGPAFTISSVGLYMLGSKQAGVLIYLSLILSSLTVGLLSRFFGEDSFYNTDDNVFDKPAVSVSLVKSVSSGSTAMLSVCAWVILFSCILKLIELLPLNDALHFAVCALLEVTNAVRISAGSLSLPLIAGIISFGGFCGHCQVMPYLIKLRLKYKFFLTARIINAALSVIYCELLLRIIPVSYEVFSMGTMPSESHLTVSAVYSISMLITAGLFLLGDSAVFRIKTKKDHRI